MSGLFARAETITIPPYYNIMQSLTTSSAFALNSGGLQNELSIGSGLWWPADDVRACSAASSIDVQLLPIDTIDAIWHKPYLSAWRYIEWWIYAECIRWDVLVSSIASRPDLISHRRIQAGLDLSSNHSWIAR
jgi:hypothetical protein